MPCRPASYMLGATEARYILAAFITACDQAIVQSGQIQSDIIAQLHDKYDDYRMTVRWGRWSDHMESPSLHREHWRESSQWFALSRAHVVAVVNDSNVEPKFRDWCFKEDG